MSKKELKRLGVIFLFFLALGIYADLAKRDISSEGTIERGKVGDQAEELELIVDVEGVLEGYIYEIEVEPRRVQEDEAAIYFQSAIKEIEKDFENWEEEIPIRDSYASNMVTAEWMFSPKGYVNSNGSIEVKEIPDDGVLITARAVLACDSYEQIYQVPFRIEKENLSVDQRITAALDTWFEEQQMQEGSETLLLPEEVDGYALQWSSKSDYITIKILILEIGAFFLILYLQKKQREKEEKNRKLQMERDYPEVVSQLSVLLESGMTIRQAWNKIAKQYEENRRRGLVEEKEVYQAIVNMNRQIAEGVKERAAYEKFAEEISLACYRRMMRILEANLEKGSRDICNCLEEESMQAYEQKILFAKKQGEEASAKMLVPMMLMMLLVIVIIMVPAFMEFSI